MAEQTQIQTLTVWDKITVLIYRLGIGFSTLIILAIAIIFAKNSTIKILNLNIVFIGFYVAIGLSVVFIHLYLSQFKRILIGLYLVSGACLIILYSMGKGDIAEGFLNRPYGPLLLIPLSGCLGFVTAKEAFCFRLIEGYLLALFMPFYLLLLSANAITFKSAFYGFLLIAAMLVFFTLRKVFMPLHCDIGDKSAYR